MAWSGGDGGRANVMGMATPDEGFDALLAGAQRGEEWALTRIYRDVQPALLRYLRVHAPGEEEDVASEVWIDVARGIGRFVGDANDFRRFVFTIARRRAIDFGRRRGRRRSDPTEIHVLADVSGRADTEADVVDRMTADEAVQRVVTLLPPDQAEVVLLRVVAGLSLAEVADVMGRRPGAVSVLQHRALRRLARRLGERDLV